MAVQNPRVPGWPERLAAVIEAARTRPFAWGQHDCCLFAADCIKAMTSLDLAHLWRGTYRDEDGASAQLRRHGYRSIRHLVGFQLAVHGFRRIHPVLAHRGDVVAMAWQTVGVMDGARVLAPGKDGLAGLSIRLARHAWAIGR